MALRLMMAVLILTMAGCGGSITQVRWRYPYDYSETNSGTSNSVTCDRFGNVYAAGRIDGRLAVVSFAPDGAKRWEFLYADPGIVSGVASSVVCGRDTYIYVAGTSSDEATNDDLTVVCLRAWDGYKLWAYRYSTDEGSATSLACGDDGNVYVSGTLAVTGGGGSTWFFALSLTGGWVGGSYRWEYRYHETQWYDRATSIAYGAGGIIYVAGGVLLWPENRCALVIQSLNTEGVPNWAQPFEYCGPNNGTYNMAHSLVCDNAGNVCAAGYSDGGGWQGDFTVISVRPNGTLHWVYHYDNPEVTGCDLALSVVCGSDGNIYAAGHITRSATGQDFAVLSLTPDNGDKIWLDLYAGDGMMYDRANAVACGDNGFVYAAGYISYADSKSDLMVVKAKCSNGDQGWAYRFNGLTNQFDGANAVATSAGGLAYAAGHTEYTGAGYGTFAVIALASY